MILTHLTYFAALTGVAECLATSLGDNESDGTLGRPARVGVVPAPEIAWDGCDCGQLAVTVQHGPYPSTRFPGENIEDTISPHCFVGPSALRCVASLVRCEFHPAPKTNGEPPTMIQQATALQHMLVAEFYMRESLVCCLGDMETSGLIDDWRVGATDYQINGACGEVAIVFWLNITGG